MGIDQQILITLGRTREVIQIIYQKNLVRLQKSEILRLRYLHSAASRQSLNAETEIVFKSEKPFSAKEASRTGDLVHYDIILKKRMRYNGIARKDTPESAAAEFRATISSPGLKVEKSRCVLAMKPEICSWLAPLRRGKPIRVSNMDFCDMTKNVCAKLQKKTKF